MTLMAHILLHTSRDVWNVIWVAPGEPFLGPDKELKGFYQRELLLLLLLWTEGGGGRKNSKYWTVPPKNAGG